MTQVNAGARLKAGDLAPDATITQAGGDATSLSALFQQRRTILVFLRHFV